MTTEFDQRIVMLKAQMKQAELYAQLWLIRMSYPVWLEHWKITDGTGRQLDLIEKIHDCEQTAKTHIIKIEDLASELIDVIKQKAEGN